MGSYREVDNLPNARGSFEQVLEIADGATGDVVRHVTKNGRVVERIDHENIRRAKLRVAARKWLASRLTPKKYPQLSSR